MSRKFFVVLLSCLAFSYAAYSEPIMLETQGSFMVGGSTVTNGGEFVFSEWLNPAGQTAYGDHAYVWYQIPVKPKKFPMVFLHGGGQSKKTWETTPDGREGFQNIFLRRGFSTYLVDQPRRGEAGFSTVSSDGPIPPAFYDRTMFTLFRLGRWPDLYEDTQFPRDEESLNQFMRQGTPNTAPLDFDGEDQWRGEILMGRKFVELVNKYGGDAELVHLPELGIKGNTHFMFSDLNNIEIADLLSKWLKEKGLDTL